MHTCVVARILIKVVHAKAIASHQRTQIGAGGAVSRHYGALVALACALEANVSASAVVVGFALAHMQGVQLAHLSGIAAETVCAVELAGLALREADGTSSWSRVKVVGHTVAVVGCRDRVDSHHGRVARGAGAVGPSHALETMHMAGLASLRNAIIVGTQST